MKASIEISLYPLSSDYKTRILNFIKRMKTHDEIEVVTNGMSSQLFGEYDVLMDVVKSELKEELSLHRTMAVMKIGDGLMRAEDIPEEIK